MEVTYWRDLIVHPAREPFYPAYRFQTRPLKAPYYPTRRDIEFVRHNAEYAARQKACYAAAPLRTGEFALRKRSRGHENLAGNGEDDDDDDLESAWKFTWTVVTTTLPCDLGRCAAGAFAVLIGIVLLLLHMPLYCSIQILTHLTALAGRWL
jgi:hypothetical protein